MKRATVVIASAGLILGGAGVVELLDGTESGAAVPVVNTPNAHTGLPPAQLDDRAQ